jgi:hypothetical protein
MANVTAGDTHFLRLRCAGPHVCLGMPLARMETTVGRVRAIPPLVLGSRIAFDDRGSHELKGLPDLWPVLAVREGGYAVDVRPVRPRRMVGPNQMGKPM